MSMISHYTIRVVAIFMLAIYMPVSAFAANSYLWCVGADGHSAIEFRTIDGSHASEKQTNQNIVAHENSLLGERPERCLDQALLITSIKSSKSATQHSAPPQDDFFEKYTGPYITTSLAVKCSNKCPIPAKLAYQFPSLQHLKTIKILN